MVFACAAVQSQCPSNCSGRGECIDGHCECWEGFHGKYCSLGESYTKRSVIGLAKIAHFKLRTAEMEPSFNICILHRIREQYKNVTPVLQTLMKYLAECLPST